MTGYTILMNCHSVQDVLQKEVTGKGRRKGRGDGKVKGGESCESRARKISERELAIRLLHCPEVAAHTKDLRQGT